MRQDDNIRARGMISMEEYLVRRQEKRKSEFRREPAKTVRATEVKAALEFAEMYV